MSNRFNAAGIRRAAREYRPKLMPEAGMREFVRQISPDGMSVRYENGAWHKAVPLKAPWDVRWCCNHDWEPHRHPSGESSFVDWDCMRCGATAETGETPPPTVWKLRRWIAERVTQYGRARRWARSTDEATA